MDGENSSHRNGRLKNHESAELYSAVVNLDSSDDENCPVVDMGPTDDGGKRKNTDSKESKNEKSSNIALERQTKKQRLAEEKMAKEATAKLNKIYKKGECMKYMNIEGHPKLWERWYMSDVPREAAQHGARVIQTPALCNPAVIVWTRTVPRALHSEGGQVKLSPAKEPCDRALYVAELEELCEMITLHKLSPHLAQIRQLCDCKLTLLVFKENNFFKNKGQAKSSVQSSPRRKTSNSNRNQVTEIDLELALTDLMVTADVDTVIVNTASELALTIVQFTKAIAEAPIKEAKRACDEKAAFYMRGDNKNCIAVDKDGVGVGRLWQQMLAVLPHSSLEISRAICAQYKSPLELFESLQAADSIAKLADIGVSRAGVSTARTRRVGPEFARKLYTLFMASDGNQLIE
ncbi:hypothetical protein PYW07_008220 [Mythimna separata]|uniref:Crossover junction endonuclease EME1 n=1 Tax=Mythimna separata TaxID=271217 RepID=A0AAD7YCM5_MYTSE|nr:hypothetical protein PYW07_008220 [Mythimna separata]